MQKRDFNNASSLPFSETKNDFQRVLSGEELITQADIAPYVEKMHSLSALPDEHFSLFYAKPIMIFLAMSQYCDKTLIFKRFNAVITALKFRRSFILPADSHSESISGKKDIWTYAVFISALLYKTDTLLNKAVIYTQECADKPAVYRWCALTGPIPAGYYYKVVDDLAISRLTSVALLPLVFNASCLTWLYRDIAAYNMAIESIAYPSITTAIGKILDKAYDLKMPASDKQAAPHTTAKKTFMSTVQKAEPINQLEGSTETSAFYPWLVKAVSDNDRLIKNCFCRTTDGIAVCIPDIFQIYAKLHDVQWQRIEEAFLTQNLHTGRVEQVTFPCFGKRNAIILADQRL